MKISCIQMDMRLGAVDENFARAEALVRETAAREHPDVVVLDADLAAATKTGVFKKAYPDRHFDCGIAEQNMIGTAAGLAAAGKTVFASTFAARKRDRPPRRKRCRSPARKPLSGMPQDPLLPFGRAQAVLLPRTESIRNENFSLKKIGSLPAQLAQAQN